MYNYCPHCGKPLTGQSPTPYQPYGPGTYPQTHAPWPSVPVPPYTIGDGPQQFPIRCGSGSYIPPEWTKDIQAWNAQTQTCDVDYHEEDKNG